MPPARMPANENERLAALQEYELLDAQFDATFDRFARLACAVTEAQVGLVSFVYGDRQVFRGSAGTVLRETPRGMSFCAYTIQSDDLLVVEDAGTDPRFIDDPMVSNDPTIRFYAGAPIVTRPGLRLGTVCVIADKPRCLTPAQAASLQDLAATVTNSLDLYMSVREIKKLAMTDSLTGTGNRAYFFEQLLGETARARRTQSPLTVVYFDCDGFKMVNNTLGHAAGDNLLRAIAKSMRENLRASDTLGRLGGDEFALILPETGPIAARIISERILAACRELTAQYDHPVSASLGVTTFLSVPDDLDSIVAAADQAMYEAKRRGRNRICTSVVRSGITFGLVGSARAAPAGE